ncbi:hypothetical protein Poly30_01780 [Planctomycetes bacterium Poly30]|uniref:Uncharacterized protein n=1 Tax=Saltatorellus ferox TaxID=2528018 RepID=A0A518EKS2_9BACT|nr:hypothetical protein Poly30_01780 [Planctomycetes bacterium Poly30]
MQLAHSSQRSRLFWTPLLAAAFAVTAGAQDLDPTGASTAPRAPNHAVAPTSAAPSSAAAGSATLIYTNIPGLPQAGVPGLPGVSFKPGTSTTNIDRVYGSPNGNWILTALTDLATADDEVVLVNGVLVQQEGQPGPWTGGVENCGTIDQNCAVNDAGDFTFATNTDGPATADDYIVTNVGGVWGFSAMEGQSIAALPGNTYDDSLDSPVLLADGTSGFSADGVDGTVVAGQDELLIVGSTLLVQAGVTIPPGQAAGGTEFMETLDFGDFWITPDGSSWLVQGDLTGPIATDDVVLVNGSVVLQEGTIIPGSGFTDPIDNIGIVGVHMDPGGNWFARGNNDVTEQDWVVRNGVVVATLGMPITPGATELWDDATFGDCFYLHVGNANGDYVIGGVTDNADELRNGVLILNGTTEICREGDPVDLDGNGLFDDDAFVNTFGNDDAFLSSAGTFYMVITVKDGAGTVLGQGFFSLDTGAGGPGSPYCTAVANSTGQAGSLTASGSAVAADNDVTLLASSLPTNAFGFFITSQTQGFAMNPGGSAGNLCVLGAVGRYVGPGQVQNSGGSGSFSLTLNLAQTPQPTGFVSVAAGETWNFQTWHRDFVGGSVTSNFTNALEIQFQ